MNKTVLIGGVAIIVALILVIQFSGIGILSLFQSDAPEEEFLQGQVEELKEEIAELESQNDKYAHQVKELHAEVQRLTNSQPGGAAAEETRQALVVREAELDGREKRLVRREEQLHLDRTKFDNEEREFYNTRGQKVEEIGEARQIKANHERMVANLEQAEERANNWLKAIYAISILFVVGIIALVVFLMHMAAKNRKIDMAMRTIDSVSLSSHDRNLLMASLGGRIIEQPRDNDSEH